MIITEIEIDKIKPDPAQPRTSIDEIDLREMAKSILTQGVINPIEVDKDLVIITGERRWRASKIAGLKTIPVRILDINPEDRFMRQVIENIHHNTMSDWDTANALMKLVDRHLFHGVKQMPREKGRPDKGVMWLHEKTGKSLGYIREKFDLLEASEPIKNAVKTGKFSATFVRAIKRTPEKLKGVIEEKILNKEIRSTDAAMELAVALEREQDNPVIVKELLGMDHSKYANDTEVKGAILKISPRMTDLIARTYEPTDEINRIGSNLRDWVRSNPREKVGSIHSQRIVVEMNFIKSLVEEWFHGNTNPVTLQLTSKQKRV